MSDPVPTESSPESSPVDELDQAVAAAEQHQQAEEDADAEEHVAVRDPQTGRIAKEPAQ